jgi:hypothetical protein
MDVQGGRAGHCSTRPKHVIFGINYLFLIYIIQAQSFNALMSPRLSQFELIGLKSKHDLPCS